MNSGRAERLVHPKVIAVVDRQLLVDDGAALVRIA
jgi:hypothetical protein